ncbi:MAG: aspartyl-tRNA synthetase [Clostridiales bacterium]|jgi:aspartyl-tRNA synthetase|nr:aspartyl-tRNA synthetase [Clostridiales bacterium]MDN5282812.1 aspartyl-tRNA synthetase [Candidatus Ozemobacter sp.]
MQKYRTHTCGELRGKDAGSEVKLSGWIHRKRNLGGVLFMTLRDNYGITQVIAEPGTQVYKDLEDVRVESVITISGKVRSRGENINKDMPTGEIEVEATSVEIQSYADIIPFQVADDDNAPETTRLSYRFLDLRREKLHKNILLRSQIIFSLRRRMIEMGFQEFQTPILTSSSPEGARDYLVPSRLYPGKFYALPQAPQQFKQLLMVSGFDRYFQIAPCFRDEDARADRSPGEFYQLDIEMSFVTQDEIFAALENLFYGVFSEFSNWDVTKPPFPRIPFEEAMLKYGSDKPDLRFACEIADVSDIFAASEFNAFKSVVENNGVVRAIAVPKMADKSRKFLKDIEEFAKEAGAKGLASLIFTDTEIKGSLAKPLSDATKQALKERMNCESGHAILMVADTKESASVILGKVRVHLADLLELREKNSYRFCWIVDFPMFEKDEETGQIQFSHNPFSMPQGGMDALLNQDPLTIKAYQYDIVCNGVELSSGAIRNHRPEIMYKAFEIAGYDSSVVDEKFGGMIRAFKFGAPPHGGIAPGVDRMVMLLANEPNIREVIAFPMNQNAQDLLMQAPSEVSQAQLKELHLKIVEEE